MEITDFAATADGGLVVAGCWNGDLRIWRASDGKELECFRASGEKAEGLAFSPSENRVIYAQKVTCMALSRDGKRIVSGAADGSVRLWDLATLKGNEHRRHRSAVRSIAFSPDNANVASGAADGEIVVWTIPQSGSASGQAFRRFRVSDADVGQIAFSPDGPWLVAVSTEQTLRLNPASGAIERMPGRGDAAAMVAGMLRKEPQAVVHPLETAFVIPFTGEVTAWFPAPLTCLRAQPGGNLWAGADVNHFCLLLLEGPE